MSDILSEGKCLLVRKGSRVITDAGGLFSRPSINSGFSVPLLPLSFACWPRPWPFLGSLSSQAWLDTPPILAVFPFDTVYFDFSGI